MIKLISFGYKFGTPDGLDPKFIIDCRHLPNPHFRQDLRSMTGKDKAVQDYVTRGGKDLYLMNDADQLVIAGATTIAFGCVGGRHRSVTVAELYAKDLRTMGHDVQVVHRELD